MKIILDLKKSVEANASDYYSKIKKLKKKLEGNKDALSDSLVKLKKLKQEKEKIIKKLETEKQTKTEKKEWYENFRWFISSDNFLVIGGRDATSNEIIVKKHAEKNDRVLHTDMIGSPFFVIKSNNKKIPEKTIIETADATVTFSRAFKLGLSTTKTFMARPEQLTKEALSGEFVPKGGFITKGKLEYIDNKINIAIGICKNKIMAGPLEAVKAHCKTFIHLEQGNDKPGKIAKMIANKLDYKNLDDIIRALPSGNLRVKK